MSDSIPVDLAVQVRGTVAAIVDSKLTAEDWHRAETLLADVDRAVTTGDRGSIAALDADLRSVLVTPAPERSRRARIVAALALVGIAVVTVVVLTTNDKAGSPGDPPLTSSSAAPGSTVLPTSTGSTVPSTAPGSSSPADPTGDSSSSFPVALVAAVAAATLALTLLVVLRRRDARGRSPATSPSGPRTTRAATRMPPPAQLLEIANRVIQTLDAGTA